MNVVLTFLSICISINAQTSTALRWKYGAPVSETYIVRPGITVTTTFNKNGEICKMLIESERRLVSKSSTPKLTLKQLDEIINELVPISERGEALMAGFVNARCMPDDDCWGTSSTYERVHMYYNSAGEDEYRYATIQWRGTACQK